ncbi:MAG: Aminotransferase class-III [Berkelbacteria bacterium GW2011_GWA1_36_9]|uniref:Aminotransferase class-III n=1 Tax=Berkelbacteria bacterium GW2011_GWA1_36_9 TaxID=1618331 RepID=A0A0G0FWF8_9BACT|nr:MAG: Aminotransferase class-III [Berkelbacteria bacterium GW2011_GWA1_36_9]
MKNYGKRKLTKSFKLWQKAQKLIPSGTQTLSKAPNQFVFGVSPIFLQKGKGAYVWDVDGNKYLDFVMALGPITLGYDYPAVTSAVTTQLHEGTIFTLPHPKETELAELLVDIIPCAEMVRFGKNGADATSAAIRAARAYTGRNHFAYCGYHGYQDWFAVTTQRNKGIPKILKQFAHTFEFNNLKSLADIFAKNPKKISAVIMEIPGQEPADNFLQDVIDLTRKNGAVFILDEIVTGFRYALGGAQEYYKIKPDLACFGKGMANGLPISAVVGKKEIMREFGEVFFSTTFGGDTLALAASTATIGELKKKKAIEHFWKLGLYWKDSFNKMAKEIGVSASVGGHGPRTHFEFRDEDGKESLILKSLFLQETVKRGILFGGPIFISLSHKKSDIDKTLSVCETALKIIKKAMESKNTKKYLKGEPIGEVFRKRD